MEIHGSDGALNRVKDIDSAQPYVCMECAGQFKSEGKPYYPISWLKDFIKEGKL